MISFIETRLFTRLVQQYLSDEEYSLLQQALIAEPEAGSVTPPEPAIDALGNGRSRQAWWPSSDLLPSLEARPNLAAYVVS
ncbi:MAG: hypothetical protein ABI537_00775 [Casimicrobiaceae bacterium]